MSGRISYPGKKKKKKKKKKVGGRVTGWIISSKRTDPKKPQQQKLPSQRGKVKKALIRPLDATQEEKIQGFIEPEDVPDTTFSVLQKGAETRKHNKVKLCSLQKAYQSGKMNSGATSPARTLELRSFGKDTQHVRIQIREVLLPFYADHIEAQ